MPPAPAGRNARGGGSRRSTCTRAGAVYPGLREKALRRAARVGRGASPAGADPL